MTSSVQSQEFVTVWEVTILEEQADVFKNPRVYNKNMKYESGTLSENVMQLFLDNSWIVLANNNWKIVIWDIVQLAMWYINLTKKTGSIKIS